jgi:ankyrin repeat protein
VETCLPAFDTHGEHAKDYPGPTALIAAAYKDSVPMAQLLLEKGAMVQYPPNSGLFSAIHAARSAEMVQLLLDNHADPEMRAWHTRPTPLDWYAYRGDVAAMRAVLQLGRFSVQEVWALLQAVQGSREAVELLIQYGADVRTTLDSCGATTLHYAARAGKLDIVTLLVGRWPEGQKEKTRDRETPLHWAALAGRTEVVKFFLECWPDSQWAMTANLDAPLHLAARVGNVDTVRLLVDHWPEGQKERNLDGDTPLHLAARSGGRIMEARFTMEGWPEGTMIRMAGYPASETPAHEAVRTGLMNVVMLLVELWPEGVKGRNFEGDTPLHLAASPNGNRDIVALLVECWPQGKEAKNDDDQTPLERLREYRRHSSAPGPVELLLLC